jgi:hypothetical protein
VTRPTEWRSRREPELPVVMETTIERDGVLYAVTVFEQDVPCIDGEAGIEVWRREVFFGSDDRHCAGGYAFIEAAREQQRIADEWRNAIIAEGR